MGYFKKAVQGISWMGLFRLLTRALALVRIIILARILLPAQFGVFGIATLVLSLLEIFTETGINVFIIQEEADVSEYVDTAWVISIFRGMLIALVVLLTSPLVVWFFRVPEGLVLLFLISLVPLIRGFINPSLVRLQKDLRFKDEFFFRSSVFLIDAVVAIILAFVLRSPVSLVWGLLAGVMLELVLSFVLLKPRPQFKFEWNKAKKIVGLGKWITLTGILTYLSTKGADIVVGKLLNPAALGVFQMSYKLSVQNIQEITDLFNRVSFPIYAKISGDKARLKRAFEKNCLTVLALVLLPSLILFFFPELVIQIALGPRWLEAVPVLRVLALFGFVRSLAAPLAPVFLAYKKQNYLSLFALIGLGILAATIVPLTLNWGIGGAAASLVIASLVVLPVSLWFSYRLLF